MTVLVTGGTGFVGSHAAARLVASGRPVRLLVRDPGKVARVPALRGTSGLEVVPGDVTDARSVDRALADCTHVVHAAAHVSLAERDAGRAEDVNVGGTERVVGGAAARGIPSVHVSSVSVFGIGHDVITVDSPLSDARSSYTHSKVRAERAVRALQDAGAPVAIVYPSGVLGPDAPGLSVNHQALAAWLRTPPRTTSGTSIIDVRDVAIAIGRVVDRPGRWMLGGEFLQWAELHSALQRVTATRIRAVPMPPRTLRFAGRVGDAVKRLISFDYPLTLEAMSIATRSCPYDSRTTRAALDLRWRPVDETLAASVRWLAAEGHIPAARAGALAP